MSQQPSIGRIVHYTNPGDPDGKSPPTVLPAIITGVNADGTVSLHVFWNNVGSSQQAVAKIGSEAAIGMWSWPERVGA